MMNDSDRRILDLFAERVRAQYPDAKVLAYGSRARGDSTWESDLDVCVILPVVTREMEDEISHIAWEVGFDNEVLITTVKFDQETFDRQDRGRIPFVKNILRDGVSA